YDVLDGDAAADGTIRKGGQRRSAGAINHNTTIADIATDAKSTARVLEGKAIAEHDGRRPRERGTDELTRCRRHAHQRGQHRAPPMPATHWAPAFPESLPRRH